ncbi:MAG: DNA-binding protein [Rhodocyclaceae bacterium]|nr:DNA-binding protein [Rhodocyclaceae bacterium]
MTLQNLLGIRLETVTPSRETVARLLAAAERNLADAALPGLSAENRFDAAYKAIMQCAMIALHANGYRTLTSRPGHHQTAIQTLPQTVGLATDQTIVLDALRKQRNLADYDGDPVSDATVRDCIASARKLLVHLRQWLAENRPDLL